MFAELGICTIDGGATMNPSTYDLLAGIHKVPAEEVLVIPNSANVIMAAETAAKLSDKQVLVVPATSQQAGLAAALALDPERALEENGQALAQALEGVRTGAVAPAARDDARGRFTRGEAVGFVEDEVIAWGEPGETLRAVLDELCGATVAVGGEQGAAGRLNRLGGPMGVRTTELVTVLAGADAPLGLGEVERMAGGRVDLELRQGGQPAYWWLLAAE
jgi:dihydroxyacetone kinase-like predicted kinase